MSTHPFDEAIALQAQADGSWSGATSPAYANMVGPYGGISTAQTLNAVLCHPQRLGDPVAMSINFCAAVSDGAFVVTARPVRTNRSTQHWVVEMQQEGQAVLTATVVTAVRRETWGVDDEPMPDVPAPLDVATASAHAPLAFVSRYEIRPITGGLPLVWDGTGDTSLSRLWVRDHPARPLDFASLSAVSDIFFPRVFIRRSTPVPVGTVSMSIYFHADSKQLTQVGRGFLLGQARAQAFRNGYFDQTGQLWSEDGVLLVTTHQLVYYKQ